MLQPDNGFSFLDELGSTFLSTLPTVVNNLTKKENSTQPVAIADQTPVNGDAYLSTDKNDNFFKDNWEKFALGGVALLGIVVFAVKK